MKRTFLLLSFALTALGAAAQNWQSTIDSFWGNYCYRELNGTWYDALTKDEAMTSMPTDNNIVLAYYWRIPEGKVRADILWTNKYTRLCEMKVRLIRPTTGEVLAENTVGNTETASKEWKSDLFGTVDFPADEFYRVEISSPNWSYVKKISNFVFQRESTKPVMKPRNFGGTSGHMDSWGSTDPSAPSGNAYDWAYVECMVPYEYQYPGTYYMTIGALSGYMGMQTTNRVGEDDFNRSVLFSQWDAANMDEDPNLPEYMQSGVMSGHPDAVHTHAGGEGSSASVMLKGSTKWWRPNKWVQFMQNTRPETVTVFTKTSDGRDTAFIYENTITTAFYKMEDQTEWCHLGTIRASGVNKHMHGWGNFIEPFTTYAGQFKHRVLYRHPAVRAVNSGKWYSCNKVNYGDGTYDRDFHYDYGRGASQQFENSFFFEMGGYGLQTDSSKITTMASDMSFVEGINLDSLNALIDQSIRRDQRILFCTKVDQTADNYDISVWKPITNLCSNSGNVTRALDGDNKTGWICTSGYPYTLALKANEPKTISSFNIYWEYKYDYRCLYVDMATSNDGQTWTTVFDSLEIRTGIDRPNITLPHPVTAQYVKFKFYHYFTLPNLMISEFRLRGDYNADRLLALAKLELDNANGLNHYSAASLEQVRQAYNDGQCSDLNLLARTLYDVAWNAEFYKYGRVDKPAHISSQRAHCLQNVAGHGMLRCTPDGRLTAAGATIEGALGAYTPAADATDPYNNWMVLHDEHYSGYYLYNLGAAKFLNLTADGRMSDVPQSFSLRATGQGYAFTANKEVIGLNATLDDAFVLTAKAEAVNTFYLYDNYQLSPDIAFRDSIQQITEHYDKLTLYKAGISRMLQTPVGVVGGFVSEDERQALQDAYDNMDNDPDGFIRAVESVDVLELDPENCLYKMKNTNGASSPYMAAANTQRLVTAGKGKGPEQLWRFTPRGAGYAIHSQGMVMKTMPHDAGNPIVLTTDDQDAGVYVLSSRHWAENFVASGQYATVVINGASSPMKTAANTASGSTWYLEPNDAFEVSLNNAGVASFYADFAFVLPEGLQAYVADHVTQDGVIKLTRLSDVVPANTPVLLRGDANTKVSLPFVASEATLSARNLFGGCYYRNTTMPKATLLTLAVENGEPVMKKPAIAAVNANQIYLTRTETMPELTTYTFDFENLADGIQSTTANAANGAAYDLQGRRTPRTVKGHIYIQNHRKYIAR